MPDSLTDWTSRAVPFSAVVRSVTDWDAQSPCDEWTARGVLDHVIDSQRTFLAGQGHELPDADGADPASRWAAHEGRVRALVSDPAVGEQSYDGLFGRTTVGQTLANFHGFDLLVHRWDIATSQGRHEEFTASELEQIENLVDAFGEHAYEPGVFARPPQVPDDADRQTRVLARTGRAVLDS